MAIQIEKGQGNEGVKQEKSSKSSKGVSLIAKKAKEELCALTGLQPSTVLGMNAEGDGWTVTIEMVEKKSIPDSMDLLGTYEVRLDSDAQLLSFNRMSLRKRGDTNV